MNNSSSAKDLLREKGSRHRFRRGLLMIGFAVLIVLASAFIPTLQSFLQRYPNPTVIPTALIFTVIFAGVVLWLLFERYYWIRYNWKILEPLNIGGDDPLKSAVQVYEIFRLYAWTKRLLIYGSLIGAIALLLGSLGTSANWLAWGSMNLYAAIGDLVAGLYCLWLAYAIGRQVHPAELLLPKVLYLLLWGPDKGAMTEEQILQRSHELLAQIKELHPLWFT